MAYLIPVRFRLSISRVDSFQICCANCFGERRSTVTATLKWRNISSIHAKGGASPIGSGCKIDSNTKILSVMFQSGVIQ